MAIDSGISGMGVPKVSLRKDEKAKQDKPDRKHKNKRVGADVHDRQPLLYQRGQTIGIVIDISV